MRPSPLAGRNLSIAIPVGDSQFSGAIDLRGDHSRLHWTDYFSTESCRKVRRRDVRIASGPGALATCRGEPRRLGLRAPGGLIGVDLCYLHQCRYRKYPLEGTWDYRGSIRLSYSWSKFVRLPEGRFESSYLPKSVRPITPADLVKLLC